VRWSWQQSGMGVFALEWLCCGACNGCVVLAVTVLCSCTNVSCCLSRFCGVGWLDAAPSPVSPSLSRLSLPLPFLCHVRAKTLELYAGTPIFRLATTHAQTCVTKDAKRNSHARTQAHTARCVCARACVRVSENVLNAKEAVRGQPTSCVHPAFWLAMLCCVCHMCTVPHVWCTMAHVWWAMVLVRTGSVNTRPPLLSFSDHLWKPLNLDSAKS
jgi:hypothetical protein